MSQQRLAPSSSEWGTIGDRREELSTVLVAQVSTREEALAALGAGADGVVLMGAGVTAAAAATAAAGDDGQASAIRLVDDLHLLGARVWVQAGAPGSADGAPPVAFAGQGYQAAYVQAIADFARAGVDGVIVDDWNALALTWPVARDAGMPVIAGGALAAPSSARRLFYERLGMAGTFISPQLSLGQVTRAAKGSGLELWSYIHGQLELLGEAASAAGRWDHRMQRGRWALNGRGEPSHLLNLRTLAAVKPLRQLALAGVVKFVIKAAGMGPVWTSGVCRVYRRELDRLAGVADQPGIAEQFEELSTTFNTGLGPGFYMGHQASEYVSRSHGGDEGMAVGTVESVRRSDGRVLMRFSRPCSGLGRLEARPTSGTVARAARLNPVDAPPTGAWQPGQRAWANAGDRVQPGFAVYMVSSHQGSGAGAARSGSGWTGPRLIDVEARADARLGEPLTVTYRGAGEEATRQGAQPRPCGEGRCLSPQWLADELARNGGRPINVHVAECNVEEGVVVAPSEVNAVRREALSDLISTILAPYRREVGQGSHFALPQSHRPADARSHAVASTRIMALVTCDVDPQSLAAAGAHGVCVDCDTPYRVMAEYFATARAAGLRCAYDTVTEVLDDDMDYAVSQMAKAQEAGAELLIVEDLALLSHALDLAPEATLAGPGCEICGPEAVEWVLQLGARGYVVPFAGSEPPPAWPARLAEGAGDDGVACAIVAGGRPHLGVTRYCVLGAELGLARRRGSTGGFRRGDCTAPCREGGKPAFLAGEGGDKLYMTFDRSCRAHVYGPDVLPAAGTAPNAIECYSAMGYDWVWLDLRAYDGDEAVGACARFAAVEA